MKRIGILTGGGDVPGLNPAIKAVVEKAARYGVEVWGIRRGWAGLLRTQPELEIDLISREAARSGAVFEASEELSDSESFIQPLTPRSVRAIDRSGGTILRSTRTNPGRVKRDDLPDSLSAGALREVSEGVFDCTPRVIANIQALGLDAIIPIGGDDTLSYGARLHREGVPVVSIPKTMDNDVNGTDYCLGFSTAVSRSVESINRIRSTLGSHERIGVIELFGRECGETALVSAYLSGADRAVLAEAPFDPDRLAELAASDREASPSRYSIIVISEGAKPVGGGLTQRGPADDYGHRKLGGIGERLADQIRDLTGIETLSQDLAYVMRSGAPDSLDLMVAANYGRLACEKLLKGESGLMVALRKGSYGVVPADTPILAEKRVDLDRFYDASEYRPRIETVEGAGMFLS